MKGRNLDLKMAFLNSVVMALFLPILPLRFPKSLSVENLYYETLGETRSRTGLMPSSSCGLAMMTREAVSPGGHQRC